MMTQVALPIKLLAANLTLVSGVISAMKSSQMLIQVALLLKLPATNLAFVTWAISAMNSP